MNPRRVVVFVVSLLVLLLGAWFLREGLESRSTLVAMQRWPRVQGAFVASSAGVEHHPARKNVRAWYAPTWAYRFTVEGREVLGFSNGTPNAFVLTPYDSEAEALSAAQQRMQASATVEVAYDPDEPTRNSIDLPASSSPRWMLWAGLGAVLLIIALGGFVAGGRATPAPRRDAAG